MKKGKLKFLYLVQNCCNKFWVEENMTDERIHELTENGCSVKSIALGRDMSHSTLL